jgi:hypothetical protein
MMSSDKACRISVLVIILSSHDKQVRWRCSLIAIQAALKSKKNTQDNFEEEA